MAGELSKKYKCNVCQVFPSHAAIFWPTASYKLSLETEYTQLLRRCQIQTALVTTKRIKSQKT